MLSETVTGAQTGPRDDLRAALRHVLWIGGASCSGKSSVARRLIERHSLHYYHFDRHERAHLARRDPARHPALEVDASLTPDERWIDRPLATMFATTTAVWRERFAMVVDDLLALPNSRTILAEGPGLLPEDVAPLLTSPRQAIWLVPTGDFKRATQPKRGGAPANGTSDPARAYENLIALDMHVARDVLASATTLGLATIEVNGTRSIEELARTVAAHFGLTPAANGAD